MRRTADTKWLKATGRRLLMARRRREWTQKELAEKCGLRYLVISAAERGLFDLPAQRLATIARALGVSTDSLLGLQGDEEESLTERSPASRALVEDRSRVARVEEHQTRTPV
jgi:transcriptional regulator with XRE-family HTH domain